MVQVNSMSQSQERRGLNGVEVIRSAEKARVLVDPMRREIVRLLAQRAMTENELADTLGLSDPSVGHHLKILTQSGLIRVVRKEVEQHGIVQKFYETKAMAHFVDPQAMPLEVERYFMPVSLERARGIVAALSMVVSEPEQVSSEQLEQFTKVLALAVMDVAPRYVKQWEGDREKLIIRIYRDALNHLMEKPKMLPESIRRLLLEANK
jgi:DNA-binding transcriptional ArsR family regulator